MKTQWQQAWMITKTELGRSKIGLVASLVLNAFIALSVYSFWNGVQLKAGVEPLNHFLLDYMGIIGVTNLGFIFSARHFKYMETDSYRNYLRKLRTMPIDMRTIVSSRFIQIGMNTLMNGSIYFGVLYILMLANDQQPVSVITYAGFVAFLLCVSLLMHMVYIRFEWTQSGKGYFFVILGIVAVYLLVSILLYLSGVNFTLSIMFLAEHYAILTILVSLIGLVLLSVLGYRSNCKLLMKQDLA
ncbi:ABC-2 transporter permease [Paenibacillus aquistagni]|uniref:ABC-2 transporter permease n=1 Tax=Paenibacillus aquistagni TaxID=1852522 RepID=UPI000B508AC7|nr:ABC-2 transporter permease [Paenibacillus aquistagni]